MTIFDTPERQKVYRDIIKKLRLIDDAFFNSCFDGDIACVWSFCCKSSSAIRNCASKKY